MISILIWIIFCSNIHLGILEMENFSTKEVDGNSSYRIAINVLKDYFSREVTSGGGGGRAQNLPPKSSGFKISKRTLENNRVLEDIPTEQYPNSESKRFLNEWIVHMSGGEGIAKQIIEELGYNYDGSVKGFDDVYKVSHRFQHHNSKREAKEITDHINSHTEVLWAEQQISRQRVKRDLVLRNAYPNVSGPNFFVNKFDIAKIKDLRVTENLFNDPLWPHQWYLFDSRTRSDLPEIDLRVIPVWESGITGKGINVLVIDDGLEWNHNDLKSNYNAAISYDLNDDDVDPSPRYDAVRSNSHGTKCAGEIAMQPNNGKCGVGVAFGASIGGIRMLDGEVSDRIEGAALAMGLETVDVISCSWGPTDDGKRVEGPGKLASMAFEKGVQTGRNGKGVIFVWAAGNGGPANDNCNCDGYSSSIYTISISTASENGESPWYSEHCASTLTSTYSSGAYSDQKIVTADIENDCTLSFSGTSAAAPLAAGIIALALEANPSMTWRDMQHAIVRSSDPRPLSRDVGWQQNGAGLLFNIKFGFGLLRAQALVKSARNWVPVPEKRICKTVADIGSNISISSGGKCEIEITPLCDPEDKVLFLEHAQILLSLNHTRRGVLGLSLTSPQGTITNLLTQRINDKSEEGFCDWPFTSVHTWGENPNGVWRLTITDYSDSDERGSVTALSLILHGTVLPIH